MLIRHLYETHQDRSYSWRKTLRSFNFETFNPGWCVFLIILFSQNRREIQSWQSLSFSPSRTSQMLSYTKQITANKIKYSFVMISLQRCIMAQVVHSPRHLCWLSVILNFLVVNYVKIFWSGIFQDFLSSPWRTLVKFMSFGKTKIKGGKKTMPNKLNGEFVFCSNLGI